ncbi:DMT family transporter [Phaeobacter gallaeciensis]|uniref:Permease of the drug/metabolite transporter (DMT) superfamily protein n=1 Tax=Phaeobacter gallaeciensis TaxID=60890 RepID=A0AAC9Z5J0_9RHOB|nr:DMT family transporter [Phaeobacter gallaeciensis]AHD08082.1 Permease of the drug/metabolite transporter (DMT) superfamily [Phaeobacter gallaeciensis DSM 26640]ATE91348.1 Permease of the drug/metabolite transporter (DMT) superfamily protein [Phaeobacter gallaeciensis]ATE95624.1 Permease of the drug/metabolite transporter (DMT) superfamily protein [Phaeobacter gallaeciensis]ATE99963.1 Permease of the drug/metabolite transporter (DMT) superfamily protein [Phaeobacter gallaeciensis]ATF04396.1 
MISRLTGNQLGALLMVGSMAGFTLNDGMVKLAGQSLPLSQILVVRGVAVSLLIYALARSYGGLRLSLTRRDWALVAGRSLAEIATTYFFLSALLTLPIANVTAILQMLPLTVTLAAVLFFGETVGWRRATAIGAGFLGMLLIVRPGTDGFDTGTGYALAAVLCITARDLFTRRMSAAVPSLTVTLMAAVSVLVFGLGLGLQETWQSLTLPTTLILLLAAGCIFIGYLFSVMVMRVGDVAAVSPFRYTGLLWALLLGWLMFDSWPDALTLFGAAIVVAAGVFSLLRERPRRRTSSDLSPPE